MQLKACADTGIHSYAVIQVRIIREINEYKSCLCPDEMLHDFRASVETEFCCVCAVSIYTVFKEKLLLIAYLSNVMML